MSDPMFPKPGDRFAFGLGEPHVKVIGIRVGYRYEGAGIEGWVDLDRFRRRARPLPAKLVTEDKELVVRSDGEIGPRHVDRPDDFGTIVLHADGTYTEYPAL